MEEHVPGLLKQKEGHLTIGKCAKQNKIERVPLSLIQSSTPTPYLKINLGALGCLSQLSI